MSNSPEYIELLYAVWYAGLTAVPMNTKLHQREFAYIYGLSHVAKAAQQVVPVSGGFDIGELVDLIAMYQGVTCFFAPTMVTRTALSKTRHADTNHPRYLEWLGSAGIARSDVEVRVVDADDHDLLPGEIGEVLVRGAADVPLC